MFQLQKKMFRDRTEPTLFRVGTVAETVLVRSLICIWNLWNVVFTHVMLC